MKTEAVISECGKYRYELSRIWDENKPLVLFIILNPSTADANKDDPTIRRCMGFAKEWGYGGVLVGNLFAYRATYPKELKTNKEAVLDVYANDINAQHLNDMYFKSDLTICAWGIPPIETRTVMPLTGMANLHYLKLTKTGNPCHPLYLPKTLTPIKYEVKRYF